MTKRTVFIVAIIFLGLIAALILWKYTFRKTEVSSETRMPDFEMEATQLIQEFEINESKADSLYLDKIILVTGTISSINEDSSSISVYLKENEAQGGVICSFDKEILDLSAVDTGMVVNIKGICNGYLMDVILNRCYLVNEDQPPRRVSRAIWGNPAALLG